MGSWLVRRTEGGFASMKNQGTVLCRPRPVSSRRIGCQPVCMCLKPGDQGHMSSALDLAKRGLGKTFPNPAVGCVIVDKDNKVVGGGYHPKAGKPHAEVYALRASGTKAKGATAYVTLEPCNHFGKTPPCSRALVDAGVERVVVGVIDPNPLVGGFGVKTLEAAGIEVHVGCMEQECYDINHDFMERMKNQS
ncbi:hypothetical protein BSKO_10980 [Bryopsis sp. KO-2023]|nr:hypothetical protein BSKO_10980 [Bryopsis sp. KO-2023]